VAQYLPACFIGESTGRAAGNMPVPEPTPLVLLHGFTQTGRSWGPVVKALGGRFPLVLPDAPGHGRSSSTRADLWETAGLLTGTAGRRAFWAGYSMGGRMALHVALAHPALAERLVVISATAGIDDPAERAARRRADEALAARIEHDGLAPFLSWWLAQPMFATLPAQQAGLEARLTGTAEGLASSLRLAGTGAQEPLWDRLPELSARAVPVLAIAGGLDPKYCEHAERLAAAVGPTATVLIVQGAGHACHLERPGEVAAAISAFCAPASAPRSESQADGH
jgi:2-succinyl-6-hydroxy-2,4-cyclohexadiene-1-carboxylate synthase